MNDSEALHTYKRMCMRAHAFSEERSSLRRIISEMSQKKGGLGLSLGNTQYDVNTPSVYVQKDGQFTVWLLNEHHRGVTFGEAVQKAAVTFQEYFDAAEADNNTVKRVLATLKDPT